MVASDIHLVANFWRKPYRDDIHCSPPPNVRATSYHLSCAESFLGGCASASHQVFDRIADRFQHLFSSSSDRAGPRHEQSDVVGQYRLSGPVRSWQALMLHDDWLLQVWRPGLPSQSQTDSHPKAAILLCVNIAATCATPRFTFRARRKNWRALCSAVGPAGHMKLVRLAAGSVSASSSH